MQRYSSYRFWVIKGKPTGRGGIKLQHTHIRTRARAHTHTHTHTHTNTERGRDRDRQRDETAILASDVTTLIHIILAESKPTNFLFCCFVFTVYGVNGFLWSSGQPYCLVLGSFLLVIIIVDLIILSNIY